MTEPQAVELAPHYYRDNFLRLCGTVESQYADILEQPEQRLLATFHRLDFTAQCLYVRLVSRVGPWFRESRLSYAELGELAPAVDQLLASDMALSANALTAPELGRLYTRAELVQAFGARLGSPLPAGKSALLDGIAELELGDAEAWQMLQAVDDGRVIAPAGQEQVQLLQLLFFGNRRQGLTEFVLSDLGVARYYPYQLDRAHRLFPDRSALEEYLHCAALSDLWYELREQDDMGEILDLADEMSGTRMRFPSSETRWHRLCNSVARELERSGEDDRALRLYRHSRRHPARERSARLLERGEQWQACIDLCREIIDGPWCEEEGEAAARIMPRVRRKLDGSRVTRRQDRFEHSRLRLPRAEGSVELLAADALSDDWGQVHYVENRLMNTLFGLAFWEQIFEPVPGAFNNPYQSVPTDMYDSGFRHRRQAILTARLAQLREGDVGLALRSAYQRYYGFQCRWVDWVRIEAALVAAATEVIPAAHLLAIWERMLFDPGENRRGFPDLIALGDEPGSYCMIEIKGPGDALQDSQKRWLRFFATEGVPAQVTWVDWLDD